MPLSFASNEKGGRAHYRVPMIRAAWITGAVPVSSYTGMLLQKNPPESIRSNRTHRRPTIGSSLRRAVKEVLLSIAGFFGLMTAYTIFSGMSRGKTLFISCFLTGNTKYVGHILKASSMNRRIALRGNHACCCRQYFSFGSCASK